MIHFRHLVLGLSLSLATQSVQAQQLQATRSHFSTDNGLCSNAIANIFQDDYGFIWIGTWNGLSRFDGYDFFNYKTGNASRIPNLHNRIYDMAIDQSQNVWLLMYDGRVFVLNRHTDKIINPFENYAGNEEYRSDQHLLVTSSGEVMVSIVGVGLYLMNLDRRGLKSELVTTGGLTITSMAEGYQSDIWLGTNDGVRRLDCSNLSIEKNAILPGENITWLHSNGYNLYAATITGAIYSFAYGQEPVLIRKPSGMEIYKLFVDSHELVWFSDKRMGVSKLDPKTGSERLFTHIVPFPEHDGGKKGVDISETDGTVWLRMNHGGYGYYNRETDEVEYFHNNPSNPWNLSNTVRASLELSEGVVWESTSRRGLDKLEILRNNIERVRPLPDSTSPVANEIRAMYYDKQRKLLMLGNKNSTLFLQYDDGTKTTITQDSQGNSIGRIYGIMKDSKGNYWLSSKDNGLYKMTSDNKGGWILKNFCHEDGNPYSLSMNSAYEAVEDNQGNIWVATYGGGVNVMTEKDGKTIFLHSGNSGMADYPKNAFQKVRTIERDKEGTIWAGTTDGILLMALKGGKVEIDRLKMPREGDKMLMSNDIVNLKRNKQGVMWVGSNGGGIAYTIGKDKDGTWLFDTFDARNGLPSEEIRSITFDDWGNTWFALEHVICSFDTEKKIFTTFSTLDGVDETIISEDGAVADGQGRVLFGTLDGYYVVDRKKLQNATGSLLKLHITDFFVDTELQSPRFNDNYDYYVPISRSVTIPSGAESFAFRFASLNYQLQHRVHYQYMLEGYDEEWQNADQDRLAHYDDVPPGTYTFKVKAFLLSSPDKYDQRTIEVIVPTFILLTTTTLWTCLGVILVIVLLLLLIRKYRRRKPKVEEFMVNHHNDETEQVFEYIDSDNDEQ